MSIIVLLVLLAMALQIIWGFCEILVGLGMIAIGLIICLCAVLKDIFLFLFGRSS